jgi:tRNA A-37 threonylcarbamoyl transferase component Bud32
VSDWERVTALFGAARMLDPEIRVVFLDAACREDSVLRAEVDRLLADGAREDSFLAEPAWADAFSTGTPLPSLGPGDVVNQRYCIEASVAGGGQALVYRATDTVLSRPVIVKVMRASGRHSRVLKSRFEEEMKALSRIDHPGVVGILDVGELADGCPFLVIQYVNGVSLRAELRNGPLEPKRAARLLRELGSALSAAHAAGVAHRDVKPENIMVQRFDDGSEALRLIDFGISKVERVGLDGPLTSAMVAGTIRYMAPEQFEGKHSVASDVYALSLVACEMLCGYPDGRALPKQIDSRVRGLIESALAFRPEERPRDIRRWCEALASAVVTPGPSRLRQRLWIAAAVLVAIVAGTEVARARWRPAAGIDTRQSVVPPLDGTSVADDLTGEWNITGVLTVCGYLCGSPVGTVFHSTATFSQDTAATFHGTYFGYQILGTLSGGSISFGLDNVPIPADKHRGECSGTIDGKVMSLKCSEYVRSNSGLDFVLNGSRTDTVVKR